MTILMKIRRCENKFRGNTKSSLTDLPLPINSPFPAYSTLQNTQKYIYKMRKLL